MHHSSISIVVVVIIIIDVFIGVYSMRDFSVRVPVTRRSHARSCHAAAMLFDATATGRIPPPPPPPDPPPPKSCMAGSAAAIHAVALFALLFCQHRHRNAITVKPMYTAMTIKQFPEARSICS